MVLTSTSLPPMVPSEPARWVPCPAQAELDLRVDLSEFSPHLQIPAGILEIALGTVDEIKDFGLFDDRERKAIPARPRPSTTAAEQTSTSEYLLQTGCCLSGPAVEWQPRPEAVIRKARRPMTAAHC